jgi:hypothetical protein
LNLGKQGSSAIAKAEVSSILICNREARRDPIPTKGGHDMNQTPITATVDIPGYESTAVLRMPNIGEWYVSPSGTPRQCQRSHRKTVALVLTPAAAPVVPKLPYVDCAVDEDGAFPWQDGKVRVPSAFYWFPHRLIGFVYADGTVRGEPYRFQSAVDPVELPVAVRIRKEAIK